jgi:hypothetical protein
VVVVVAAPNARCRHFGVTYTYFTKGLIDAAQPPSKIEISQQGFILVAAYGVLLLSKKGPCIFSLSHPFLS